jgi:hypothetical protein
MGLPKLYMDRRSSIIESAGEPKKVAAEHKPRQREGDNHQMASMLISHFLSCEVVYERAVAASSSSFWPAPRFLVQ